MIREWIYSGVVTRVVDADTYDIWVDLGFELCQNTRFRLVALDRDYDAPETWRPKYESERIHGEAATGLAKELVENKPVVIKSVRKGKYRYVAALFYTDENGEVHDLAEVLIENGYQKLDESEYIRLDEVAKSE